MDYANLDLHLGNLKKSDLKEKLHKILTKLYLKKIKNFILKDIIGVHNKASNLAISIEFGSLRIIFRIYKFSYKYYYRLQKIVSDRDNSNLHFTTCIFRE